MLRMHFNAEDLARTRIADGPDPLWEAVLSVHQLTEGRRPDPALCAWRSRGCRRGRAALQTLRPLMPPRGYFPDFLTPAASIVDLEAGIDVVLSTPRRRLHTELTRVADRSRLPGWTRALADGEPNALHRLGRALRQYHASVLQPGWRWITARTERDRLWRAQTLSTAGTEAMLRTFDRGITWQSPVLTAAYPIERDVHLQGRGLLLVPSYFCRGTPVALADGALPPILVYPAARPPTTVENPTVPGELAPLLGHTRAAVLQSLSEPCTTTELAHRAGVSPSSASEHAAVLRGGGLITSTRHRNRVYHRCTPLGTALLTGHTPPPGGTER